MAIWPFNRNNSANKPNGKTVPKEVQQYYASERRERVGLAWLIAFVSLIVTMAVILGLFAGGRWLYHKVHHKGTTTTIKTPKPTVKEPSPAKKPAVTSPKPSSHSTTNKTPSQPSTNVNPGVGSAPKPAPNSTATPPAPSTAQTQSPSASPTITNTGPGQTIGVFAVASIAGTIAYELHLRRRLKA